jgi:hypothetical protein
VFLGGFQSKPVSGEASFHFIWRPVVDGLQFMKILLQADQFGLHIQEVLDIQGRKARYRTQFWIFSHQRCDFLVAFHILVTQMNLILFFEDLYRWKEHDCGRGCEAELEADY